MLNVNYNTTFPRTSARNLGYVNLSGLLPFTRVLFRTWLNLETFSVPFVAQLANICVRRKVCVLEVIMFLIRYKTFSCSQEAKLASPEYVYRGAPKLGNISLRASSRGTGGGGEKRAPSPPPWACSHPWKTFVLATMFPSLSLATPLAPEVAFVDAKSLAIRDILNSFY